MTPEHIAARCLSLIDLTKLGEADTIDDITALCRKAQSRHGAVAAVCVHPEYIVTARRLLDGSPIRIATVVNFPDGSIDVVRARAETRRAMGAGADEIDVVLPWRDFLSGHREEAMSVVRAVRSAAPDAVLKVILETGAWPDVSLVRHAADLILAEGAAFLKTSTGKSATHATPAAAGALMQAVRDAGNVAGVKISGGIRTIEDARVYLQLADDLLGESSVRPSRFRFGASVLLDDVFRILDRSIQ